MSGLRWDDDDIILIILSPILLGVLSFVIVLLSYFGYRESYYQLWDDKNHFDDIMINMTRIYFLFLPLLILLFIYANFVSLEGLS
jgi:hypothetical protein